MSQEKTKNQTLEKLKFSVEFANPLEDTKKWYIFAYKIILIMKRNLLLAFR